MDELKTIEEQYAHAAVTGRLCGGSEDVLIASGMAGQKNRLATQTWRLLDCLDSAEYKGTLEGYKMLLLSQARRQSATVSLRDVDAGARAYLSYVIAPVCPTCQGRGASLLGDSMGGRGVLDDAPCKTCGGSGKRSLRREAAQLGDVMEDLVLWLNGEVLSQCIEAQRSIRRKKYNHS